MSVKLRQAIDVIDSIIADVDAGRRLSAPDAAQPSQPAAGAPAGQPKKKDKKAKKDKAPADASKKPWLKDAAPAAPALDPIQQADLRVARVVAVEAVDGSDKLWKCQVDCGDAEPRQIVAGLQQYISRDDMLKRSVVAICNLKAAKLAGQVSEGMLLAASSPDKGVVRTLVPPDGAEPGEQVFCKGGEPVGDKPKVLKTKLWQEVVPQLTVKGRKPCHKDDPLCTKSGGCTIPDDVPDGSTIS